MVAAENGALKGAKVGGMADVIRDLPQALAGVGIQADIIMPSYGFLTDLGAKLIHEFEVSFAGRQEPIKLYWLAHPKVQGANIYLLEHGLWQSSPGQIYSQGTSDRPFADDATKFALLCASVAKALVAGLVPMPELLHLHDWHTGCLAMLRALAPEYQALQSIECVFSIHNLALQGIRPLSHDTSSFAAWFPHLFAQLDEGQRAQIIDPRYPHCINPMRMGITLADKVHLVSPTYAKEVLLPSRPELGFFGGEIALAIWVRPVIHISRNAEVKQICARSINRPKPTPQSIAIPSLGALNIVSNPQPIMAANTNMPIRKRRLAWFSSCLTEVALSTFFNFTGMRNIGSSVKRAPK